MSVVNTPTNERYVADLGDRIGVLTAQINSLTVELAAVVGAFDQAGGWGGGGFRSISHWLGFRAGWSTTDASRLARVGARLDTIPTLAAAADRGEISITMLDAAARITTPDNETAVADVVRLCTPAQATRVLGSYRQAHDVAQPGDCMNPGPDEPTPDHPTPLSDNDLWWREWVDHRGRGRIDAAIDPDTLERLRLARAAHETNRNLEAADGDHNQSPAPTGSERPPRNASPSEALRRVAEAALTNAEAAGARDTAGERYVVQITADLATIAAVLGIELHSNMPIGLGNRAFVTGRDGRTRHLSDAELSEALCDATLQLLIHNNGVPLWLGNETRHATRHQRRALRTRASNTCEYPGCTTTRYLEPHHVRFHSTGGPTSLDNLVLLCWNHHHQLHQHRYEIRNLGHQTFGFYSQHSQCLGSNTTHGPQPDQPPLHHRARPSKRQGRPPDRHLRLVDPDIPKPTGRGEPLTAFALDVLVTKLLHAS